MKPYYYHGLDYHLIEQKYENLSILQSYLLEIRNKQNPNFKLKSEFNEIPSPFLLPDIEKSLEVLEKHISKKSKIMISGDKDSDGICSTVLLGNFLRTFHSNLIFDFSSNDDYGFSTPLLKHILSEKPDLFIALDFGTRQNEEIETLKQNDIEIIVIDHHEPKDILPSCLLINPKKKNSLYKERDICTAHLTFQFITAHIYKRISKEPDSTEALNSVSFWSKIQKSIYFESTILKNLDLVAIATITDMMPLLNSNRFFVTKSCEILTDILKDKFIHYRPATKVLLNHFKQDLIKINSTIIGWKIGPLINAAGRMKKTEVALKFFLSTSEYEAKEYLKKLLELNEQRKERTISNIKIIEKQIIYEPESPILFLYSQSVLPGVSGIVATNFMEKYKKTTIFLAPEKDFVKGSVRAVGKENILELLETVQHLLIQFGGHNQAGGFSIKFENIVKLEKALLKNAKKWWGKEKKQKEHTKGSIISLKPEQVQKNLIQELECFEPFGMLNENPLFSIKNATIYNYIKMKEIHAKFRILSADQNIECIIWNESSKFDKLMREYQSFDFWGSFEKNYYRRQLKFQFIIYHFEGNELIEE